MQPTYLPWLGYFELIAKSDVFIFLDCVQYVHQTWQSRNRLKGNDGNPIWLSVPVKKHSLGTVIKDIQIANRPANWKRKHLNAITTLLGKTPYFDKYRPGLADLFNEAFTYLADLNIATIKLIADWLDLKTEFFRASEMNLQGKRTDLLLDICQKVEATRYYSPVGASIYLEDERAIVENHGIEVRYQDWNHPVYPQKYGSFVSHMSALDAIINVGGAETRRFLISEQANG